MTEIVLTERETQEGLLVSACDADVIGETFENGDVTLDVEPAFYDGEGSEADVDEDRLLESLAACSTANLVGDRTVELAIEGGFVDAENVLDLDGTRHAQLVWL
jgi:hypothetical protein